MKRAPRNLKRWLRFSTVTFLVILLAYLALPAIFLVFQVPSFSIGQQGWILRWQNDANGSGIQFNFLLPLLLAIVIGLLLAFLQQKEKTAFK